MKYLGEHLDIHCGGIDNAFPHHTNEIAQSEAYLGHKWCNWWVHVLHLNTSGGKMSKSKGEFLTVSLLEEKGYDPMVYRFFCLQSHYRKSLVFTYENLDNAKIAYNKLIARIAAIKDDGSEIDQNAFAECKKAFTDALDNDINTSLAVTALYDVLKAKTNNATKLALIADFDSVLCLDLLKNAEKVRAEAESSQTVSAAENSDDPFVAEILDLIEQRKKAKKEKNYAEADRIRNYLAGKGVTLIDTPQGTDYKLN